MKILYFTADFSDGNRAFAAANGLIMRNAAAWYEGDFIETCDAVCGDVPTGYAHLPKHAAPSETPSETPKRNTGRKQTKTDKADGHAES